MKISTKLSCFMLALAIGVFLVPAMPASAATADKRAHIMVKSHESDAVTVKFKSGEYKLKNVKCTSKNKGSIILRTTYVDSHSNQSDYEKDYPYGYARIGMYARKAGTYKVEFDVVDKSGEKTTHHTVTVYANNKAPFKSVKLGGKPVASLYGYTTMKSGKFKVTMNKKFKLKSITMTTFNKNGKAVKKKIKNGAKVTLGSYRYKTDSDRSEGYEYWNAGLLAETTFTVTYQDGYSGQIKTSSYSFYRWPRN